MAAVEKLDLRLAAALGFGRYDWISLGTIGAAATATTIDISKLAPNVQRPFMFVGDLIVPDVPPDLVQYQYGLGGVNASIWRRADAMRTPLMILLSGEQPSLSFNFQLASYPGTYGVTPNVSIDVLVGQQEQWEKLIKWAGDGFAPVSIVEGVVQAVEGLVAEGGWY